MNHLSAIEPFLRKTPKQHRSRMRLEALLDTTAELIHEAGTDRVTVTMVADRLGIASSSIYEYVDEVSQLVVGVAVRGQEQTLDLLREFGSFEQSDRDLRSHFVAAANFFIERLRTEPGLRVAMAAIDSDQRYQAVSINGSRKTAAVISAFLYQGPDRDLSRRIHDKVFLLVHLAHGAAGLFESVEAEERDRLIAAYVDMYFELVPNSQ